MKQTRAMSLVESLINIAVGFGLAIGCQALVLPALGVDIPWRANFLFAVFMTAVSIARQFALRRLFEALHIRKPLSPAMAAVIAERIRQVEVEGWSIEHDDCHPIGELGVAGASYAMAAALREHDGDEAVAEMPETWPWSSAWWKPQNFRRDLVRAGALILAEIEKFDHRRKPRGDWDRPLPPARVHPQPRGPLPTVGWPETSKFERFGTQR